MLSFPKKVKEVKIFELPDYMYILKQDKTSLFYVNLSMLDTMKTQSFFIVKTLIKNVEKNFLNTFRVKIIIITIIIKKKLLILFKLQQIN